MTLEALLEAPLRSFDLDLELDAAPATPLHGLTPANGRSTVTRRTASATIPTAATGAHELG